MQSRSRAVDNAVILLVVLEFRQTPGSPYPPLSPFPRPHPGAPPCSVTVKSPCRYVCTLTMLPTGRFDRSVLGAGGFFALVLRLCHIVVH